MHGCKYFARKDGDIVPLAAGVFHRDEVPIEIVEKHMRERGIETR